MTDTGTRHSTAPVVREVIVRTDLETAFRLFTDRIGDWWPMARHSVFGEHATVAFEDGRLVERAGTTSTTWGEVLAWDPPQEFRITWHPGHDADEATEVAVAFTEQDGETLVRLTHTGWERRARAAVRASYETGWVLVLERYAGAV
jgi:activator of Hsp90 ATPase-like protein